MLNQVENVKQGEEEVQQRRVVEGKKPVMPLPPLPQSVPSIPKQHSPIESVKEEQAVAIQPAFQKRGRSGESNGLPQMSTLPCLPLPDVTDDMDLDNSPLRSV